MSGYDLPQKRRAHLLNVLEESGRAMTTNELWETCPVETYTYYGPPPHGERTIEEKPRPNTVYADLRKLERDGDVERIKLIGGRIQWGLTADGKIRRHEVAMLEEWFKL